MALGGGGGYGMEYSVELQLSLRTIHNVQSHGYDKMPLVNSMRLELYYHEVTTYTDWIIAFSRPFDPSFASM